MLQGVPQVQPLGSRPCRLSRQPPPAAGREESLDLPLGQRGDRHHADPVAERVMLCARIEHREVIETEVCQGDPHRGRQRGRIGTLDFNAEPSPTREEQQIELRPVVRRPEVGLVRPHQFQNLLDGVPLPGSAALGVRCQLVSHPNPEELMQQPGVPEVDLGCLDLPLLEVLVPWRELTNHEEAGEEIEVSSDRRLTHPE
jgi:hypothetical protein